MMTPYELANELVRVHVASWLALIGLDNRADSLRLMPPLANETSADRTTDLLRVARMELEQEVALRPAVEPGTDDADALWEWALTAEIPADAVTSGSMALASRIPVPEGADALARVVHASLYLLRAASERAAATVPHDDRLALCALLRKMSP